MLTAGENISNNPMICKVQNQNQDSFTGKPRNTILAITLLHLGLAMSSDKCSFGTACHKPNVIISGSVSFGMRFAGSPRCGVCRAIPPTYKGQSSRRDTILPYPQSLRQSTVTYIFVIHMFQHFYFSKCSPGMYSRLERPCKLLYSYFYIFVCIQCGAKTKQTKGGTKAV